ncbi:hypothetical protein LXL04_029542 [Taraxacum kok-saghyz]
MELSKMLLPSPTSISIPLKPHLSQCYLYNQPSFSSRRRRTVRSKAKQSGEEVATNGIAEKLAIAGGLIANPVIGWSLYTLKTTRCGLPPGPGGSIGALEGVSYLVVNNIRNQDRDLEADADEDRDLEADADEDRDLEADADEDRDLEAVHQESNQSMIILRRLGLMFLRRLGPSPT